MAEIKRSFAIIIGVNQYINGIPLLETAVNDASELAKILAEEYEYKVLQLLDADATQSKLNDLLAAFVKQQLPLADGLIQMQESDRLLFYFGGHGIALDGLDNTDGPAGYVVPQDARRDDSNTWVAMQRLHDALIQLPCRHLLIILDCCFAGAFRWAELQREAVRSHKMYQERYQRFISGCAQQVITSAADDEKAADSLLNFGQRGNINGHSPFAELLFKALLGQADFTQDGVITATEIYLYINNELAKTIAKQTPGLCQLKRHDKGEYIFPILGFDPKNLDKAPPLDESKNPYRGLESFEEKDSSLFFGRKALIEKLQKFIISQPLTVVLGASGSGKSSLVKAGLIPQLKNSGQWRIFAPIRPGKSPFIALNNTLVKENFPIFTQPYKTFEQELQTLYQSVKTWSQANPNTKLLLFIDQFEELVTLCQNDKQSEIFITGLARAIKAFPEQLRIVVTLRSDFEPQFRDKALKPYWQKARFIIPAMTRQELRSCITEPATARVLYFDPPNLVDQLIDEVAQMPGALPLLSFTLSELYLKYIKSTREDKRNNRAITQADYDELGGVTRSLTQRADYEYDELVKLDSAYAQTIKQVMLRMVAIGGGELARRQVLCTELEYPEVENARAELVIERFVAARLLVKGQDTENHEYVEPAHDVLVRGWNKLRTWKQEEQENLILQRRLTPAALEWKTQQKPRFLWNADPRLDLLKQILNSNNNWFNKIEAEFVRRSVRQKRKNATLRGSIISGALIVLSSATIIAIKNWIDAENQVIETTSALSEARLASNNQLEALVEGVKAGEMLKKDLLREGVKAGEMLKKDTILTKESTKIKVVTTLLQLANQVRERNRFEGHTQAVRSVIFTPDGKTIASASNDSTIKLWNLKGQCLQTLTQHEDGVFRVLFSKDGKTLISASNNTLIIWQRQPNGTFKLVKPIPDKDQISAVSLSPDGQIIATGSQNTFTLNLFQKDGKLIKTWKEHRDQIRDLSFSPDNQIIATASVGGAIKLWSVKERKLLKTIQNDSVRLDRFGVRFVDNKTIAATNSDRPIKLLNVNGTQIKNLQGHTEQVLYLDVSRDGKYIASANKDETVKIWSPKSDEPLPTLVIPDTTINQASFSPDSKMIALAGDDNTVKLWNINSILPPTILQSKSISVSFSPDSKMIVSASGKNIQLWQNGKRLWNVQADNQTVLQVSFSHDGKLIASAGEDGIVKLWNTQGKLIRTIKAHLQQVSSVSFSPDSKTIASASDDKTVKLWNVANGSLIKTIPAHNNVVTSVSFSPDGKTIASASLDKTIKLWNVPDGRFIKNFPGHKEGVLSVSFSPNGKMLASASSDKTVRLWHLNNQPSTVFPLEGNSVMKVNFSPNGQTLVSASGNKIRLWKLNGELITTLPDNQGDIFDASFSPDGKTIASADPSENVILWNLDLDNLLKHSCNWLDDYLKNKPKVSEGNLCKPI
ncbi:nSTAND1 domain-containing NTPase [Tolypothrix sp. VBCCA 56010]|uniref:nSTAND1 domain-containing NTPase n=1 Tax=Tolypothrix sp. VBCCA 56010 TaxID=3137731 RepID=UPI003D7DFCF4